MWSSYQTNRVEEQVTNPVEGDSFLGGSSEPERGYNAQREIGKRNATKRKQYQPVEVLLLLDRVSEGWNTLVYNKGVCYDGHSCHPSPPIKLEKNITNCYGLHESGSVTVVMCVI